MKTFILFISLALTSLSAFAQIADFSTLDLPSLRKLDASENEQKEFMSCVVKFIEGRRGGERGVYTMVDLLNDVLEKDGELTKDSEKLTEGLEKCRVEFERVGPSTIDEKRFREIMRKVLYDTSLAPENPIRGWQITKRLNDLYSKIPLCFIKEVSLNAAVVMGAGVALNKLNCVYPTGRTQTYIGGGLKLIAFQIGAYASYTVVRNPEHLHAGDKTTASIVPIDEYARGGSSVVFVLGDQTEEKFLYPDTQERVTQRVGLAIIGSEPIDYNLGFRIWNGKRRWAYVLDHLNKPLVLNPRW